MSIKTSQAIRKCFIDLRSSVWFTLCSILRSKRFQSSYCAKVRAEAKKKKIAIGRGRGEEETLARKPHDSEQRPLIFHGSARL